MADKPLEIVVNMEKMTISDLELLDQSDQMSGKELIEFLDRIVEGDVRALPITALPQIVDAIKAQSEAVFSGN